MAEYQHGVCVEEAASSVGGVELQVDEARLDGVEGVLPDHLAKLVGQVVESGEGGCFWGVGWCLDGEGVGVGAAATAGGGDEGDGLDLGEGGFEGCGGSHGCSLYTGSLEGCVVGLVSIEVD